jgi:hypothetical protein
MWRIWIACAVALCLFSMSMATEGEGEKEVKTKVVAVSLFKNGLAVVKRQVTFDGAGAYRVADVPEPVHGTYWVESTGLTESRVEVRETTLSTPAPLGTNLPMELAGLKVTIRSRDGKTVTTGVVQPPPKKEKEEAVEPPVDPYSGYRTPPVADPVSRFLILKTEKGIAYVDLGDIGGLEVEGEPKAEPRTRKKPVLLLVAGDKAQGDARISYLAHGLSWAPSYKVDLTNAKSLSIEQHAVIRNELADLVDTEVSLISGYPSVQFSQVISPLSANQTWTRFFQQLSSRGGQYEQQIMMQNAAYNMRAPGGGGGAAPEVAPNLGDTIDLNYHSIGKKTLKKGAALALVTGQATTDYERIVDWTIPDNRNEWGQPTSQSNNRRHDPNTGDPLQDDVWDALKFKNPLPFPMTTAPATVTTTGIFSGQRQVYWTNKGEEATLRVNKALSIRARHVEYENQTGANGTAERDIIYIGGQRFRRATVNGELRLCNHRGSEIKLIAKRQFSGDYVKGDGDPKIDLREEGVWTVNKRNELTWTINLKPGEERVVKFQYTVLVHF